MPLKPDKEMVELFDNSPNHKLYTPKEVTLEGISTFGWQDYKITELVIPTHYHKNCFEFHYVVDGAISFQIKDQTHVAKNGEVMVIFPNEFHGTEGSSLHGHKMYWFGLKDQEPILGLSPEGSALLLDRLRRLPCRVIPVTSVMKTALPEGFVYANSPDLYHRQYAQAQMTSFLYHLIQNAQAEKQAVVSPEIQESVAFMHEQLLQGVPLSAVAEHIGYSLSHFKAKFKREMGVPPADFYMGLRIDKAKHLLKQGFSVTETANTLNFSSPNYFSTAFYRSTETTPTQYINAKRLKPPQ